MTYFIADIAANHDKNLNRCFELIYKAKEAGADAVKFQHYRAANLISKKGFKDIGKVKHQEQWEKTVYETFADFSLPYEWTGQIADYCKTIGVDFMSTPYDLESVDIIDPYVKMHKLGSGDINYPEIIDALKAKNKKILIGTGASDFEDVSYIMSRLEGSEVVLMQCNTNYTGSIYNPNYINLNVLKSYQEIFNCEVGISDHNKDNKIILGAVAMGAKYVERHFTDGFSRSPDNSFAMRPYEWREMVNEVRALENLMGDGVKRVEENEIEERTIQRRAWYSVRMIKQGEKIRRDMVEPKRPAIEGAISTKANIIGMDATIDIEEDTVIKYGDLA